MEYSEIKIQYKHISFLFNPFTLKSEYAVIFKINYKAQHKTPKFSIMQLNSTFVRPFLPGKIPTLNI